MDLSNALGMQLRITYLVVLAFYSSIILSAGNSNSTESETGELLKILAEADFANEPNHLASDDLDAIWEDLMFKSESNKSYYRTASMQSSSQDLNHFLLKRDQAEYSKEGNINIGKNVGPNEQYFLEMANYVDNANTIRSEGTADIFRSNSDLLYFYENKKSSDWLEARSTDRYQNPMLIDYLHQQSANKPGIKELPVVHEGGEIDKSKYQGRTSTDNLNNNSMILIQNNLYQEYSNFRTNNDKIKDLASASLAIEDEDGLKISDSYDRYPQESIFVDKMETHLHGSEQAALSSIKIANDLNTLVQNRQSTAIAPYTSGSLATIYSDIGKKTFIENISLSNRKRATHKNYAIVVGINEYKDRRSLHNSVNDAEAIKSIFSSLGYEVILLSDNTREKPTKSNILKYALANQKHNIGNTVFYFSGHAEIDHNGDFYLIPQDANGDQSTYISIYELERCIKDIKNLAIIIDACNGEGLVDAIGEDQIILASSKANEPSNEEWIGSLSVFTSNLCSAIMDEKKNTYRILLQKCFSKAYNDTVIWSKGRLLSQTPVIKDMTGGNYYLK